MPHRDSCSYGHSEGVPTEDGLALDAEAIFEYARNREDIDASTIYVFGRSLGGAVAIQLAQKEQDNVRSVS